jgi:hypothetical protein
MPALAQHSAATVEHGSPHEIVALARHVFGGVIDCDPCTSHYWNRHVVKAGFVLTEGDNALELEDSYFTCADGPVFETYFINPPGGLILEFWQFACKRWLEGAAVFWLGFNLDQMSYLQRHGAMFNGFQRVILPYRLAFLQARAAMRESLLKKRHEAIKENASPRTLQALDRRLLALAPLDGPPVPAPSPTRNNYLLLMPSTAEQSTRFAGACRLMPAEAF